MCEYAGSPVRVHYEMTLSLVGLGELHIIWIHKRIFRYCGVSRHYNNSINKSTIDVSIVLMMGVLRSRQTRYRTILATRKGNSCLQKHDGHRYNTYPDDGANDMPYREPFYTCASQNWF